MISPPAIDSDVALAPHPVLAPRPGFGPVGARGRTTHSGSPRPTRPASLLRSFPAARTPTADSCSAATPRGARRSPPPVRRSVGNGTASHAACSVGFSDALCQRHLHRRLIGGHRVDRHRKRCRVDRRAFFDFQLFDATVASRAPTTSAEFGSSGAFGGQLSRSRSWSARRNETEPQIQTAVQSSA